MDKKNMNIKTETYLNMVSNKVLNNYVISFKRSDIIKIILWIKTYF